MTGPLQGIRIVDCLQAGQGGATCLLADMGADVIKVEQPGKGDFIRGVRVSKGVSVVLPTGSNTLFETLNRNKKGIAIDITQEKGKEIIYRLVAKADVFAQNMRKGVAEKLGLDYEALRRINPKLVYASGTGYGPLGPDSSRPAIDLASQARSGVMMSAGAPDAPPQEVPHSMNDMVSNLTLAYGILLALMARERFGIGQHVENSLLGSMINVLRLGINSYLLTGNVAPRSFRNQARNPLHIAYKCQDGQWLQLGLAQSDRYWADFCQAMGLEELKDEPRFRSDEMRGQNRSELIAYLDQVFATRTRADWLGQLRSKDLICEVVNTIQDLVEDPQVQANRYIAEFEHPALGAVKMVGIPVSLSSTPGSLQMPAPELGQHTEEVLLELCNYTWEDLARLKENGVIP